MIRSDAGGALVAATVEENRAEVRKLDGDDWKPLLNLVAKTGKAGDETAFFPKAKPDAERFVEIVAPVPAIALSDGAERVAWLTSGGAILAMATADPRAKPVTVQGLGPLSTRGTVVLPSPARSLAISREGSLLAVGMTDKAHPAGKPDPRRLQSRQAAGSVSSLSVG